MRTEKQRGIKPRKEEDNDKNLKKVSARRRKSTPHLFTAPIISTTISPAHVYADYPVTASSGGKWNYIVCAECPKVNNALTFPLWYCFHTYII